ncbi:MAG: hypothetical protein IKA84_01140 [Clostridia bacterium]|nr:hypothetical protein [Clostridia bacterium]
MKKLAAIILIIVMLSIAIMFTSCDAWKIIGGALGVANKLLDEHIHTPGEIAAVESTCSEHGLTEGSYCLTCGETLIPQREAPLKAHQYDGDSDAVCNSCGYERYCMHHNTRIIQGKAATCTEEGLTAGEECVSCGAIIIECQAIPAKGHTEGILNAVDSTCIEHGLTEGTYCTVCEKVLVPQTEAPLKPHTEGVIPAVGSTCTKAGLTEGKYCTSCDKVLVAQQEAPLKNHSYTNDADMSCNNCTYQRGCTHPQASLKTLPAKAATCTATGLTEGVQCGNCNEIIVAQTVVDVKSHTEVTISAVAATCTQTGLTEGKKCSTCGKITVAQQTVALKSHTEGVIPAVAATCTSTGLTEGKKCTVCQKILTAQQTTSMKSHTESAWIIDTASTETTEGLKHTECTVCKKVLKQEVITENVVYTITTKTGTLSSSPKITYSAVIEYRNRTANSVEIRVRWTTTIAKYYYTRYGQMYNFTINSAKSSNVKVLSFDSWKSSSSSARSSTGTSEWMTVYLNTASATAISMQIYYWQFNSNNLDMYKYDGTECVNKTWTLNIPAK